uniref:Uncharacterized protein n=1 Tax=Hyaloperonospora arabidopsidis (strain Emoy2) TaxID=559515 RepID=M4BZ87_HYAAE
MESTRSMGLTTSVGQYFSDNNLTPLQHSIRSWSTKWVESLPETPEQLESRGCLRRSLISRITLFGRERSRLSEKILTWCRLWLTLSFEVSRATALRQHA